MSALALAVVLATPRALPFSYTSETLPRGEAEIEQYVDLSPVRTNDPFTGEKRWFAALQMQTEIEYGVSPRLELGLYATWVPTASVQGLTEGRSKQRLRYQLVEAKILLQRSWACCGSSRTCGASASSITTGAPSGASTRRSAQRWL